MPRRIDVVALRSRCGYSQAGLAEALGVSERSIRRWELAEADPSPMAIRHLQALAQQHDEKDASRTAKSTDTTPAPKPAALGPTGARRLQPMARVLPSLP